MKKKTNLSIVVLVFVSFFMSMLLQSCIPTYVETPKTLKERYGDRAFTDDPSLISYTVLYAGDRNALYQKAKETADSYISENSQYKDYAILFWKIGSVTGDFDKLKSEYFVKLFKDKMSAVDKSTFVSLNPAYHLVDRVKKLQLEDFVSRNELDKAGLWIKSEDNDFVTSNGITTYSFANQSIENVYLVPNFPIRILVFQDFKYTLSTVKGSKTDYKVVLTGTYNVQPPMDGTVISY